MAYASYNTRNFNHGFPTAGPQNPTTMDVLSHIFFASNQKWKDCQEKLQFDYIVIGSGFCSYAFIQRLLEPKDINLKEQAKKLKILVLEKGNFFLPSHFQNLPAVYKNTLPDQQFLNETFPWTLSYDSAQRMNANWCHGIVPFFGGRSTLWSAWCPRPDAKYGELIDWPPEVTEMLTEDFFKDAEALLGVVKAGQNNNAIPPQYRVYSTLQVELEKILSQAVTTRKINCATRSMAAPLAIADNDNDVLMDFHKFSVVAPFLQLQAEHKDQLTIVTDCVVERIIRESNIPTALETSRGILPLVQAKLILGVGCMPAATLLLNSFPANYIPNVGKSFSAHFITAIVARVPRKSYPFADKLNSFELAALYLAGVEPNSKLQFHAQISVLSDKEPEKHASLALRYMPDVVATASFEQLQSSREHVVFVFAVLGELDIKNQENRFSLNEQPGNDKTANCVLHYSLTGDDEKLWDSMDKAAFQTIENGLNPNLQKCPVPYEVEYWHGDAWKKEQNKTRVDGMVHESSLIPLGKAVDFNFSLKGVKNIYITGSGLWPTGASWNPTMTMCGFAQKLADKVLKIDSELHKM